MKSKYNPNKIITVLMCSIIALCVSAQNKTFYGLPVYDIDGISYALYTDPEQETLLSFEDNFGATVVPNEDKAKMYSGKIKIPETITIEGTEYPVVGFVRLSAYTMNESENLEIILPNTINVMGMTLPIGNSPIKSINIPSSTRYIANFEYSVSRLTIPGSVKNIGYLANVSAEELIIEDGVETCDVHSIACSNKILTLPGTIKLCFNSLGAQSLEGLIIRRSKTKDATPVFKANFCDKSYNIKTIVCEYENPPKADNDAFCLGKDEKNDPLFPGYDEPYNPGMYDRATLYVPKAAVEAYKADAEWGRFEKILAIEDNADIIKKLEGVDDISADAAKVVATEYYDLSGRRLEAPAERGFTITATIYSDGTRRCAKTVR